MSGDKLLGGPQAGLVAGTQAAVDAMRRNPLARALRIDKLTLAALQATLLSYASMDGAERALPTLRLILAPPADIEARARRLLVRLGRSRAAVFECGPSRASVGGGAFAELELPSFEVRARPVHLRANVLLARLRRQDPAIVARIKDDVVGFDLRCIGDDEVELLAVAIERALGAGGGDA
jgi:L-seryl-tRNA(Ser) seleniumtransferase